MSGAEDTDFEADDDQTQQQDLGDLPADLQALVAAVTADQHEIPDMFNLENTQLYGESSCQQLGGAVSCKGQVGLVSHLLGLVGHLLGSWFAKDKWV